MNELVAPEHLQSGFVLTAAAIVFLMQSGFCLLESGLVRAKNSINVAVKNAMDACIAILAFLLIGFPLMFGSSQHGLWGAYSPVSTDSNLLVFLIFQMVFCSTAATIVSGAVAERTKLKVYLFITVALSTLVYPVIGHWCWGGTLPGTSPGWLAALGFKDWAGGTVVHVVGGFAALAAAIVIGPRRMPSNSKTTSGHSLPLAILGVFILWFGWWGFNGGSGLALDSSTPLIVINTNLGAVAGGLTGAILSLLYRKRIEVVDLLNGVLAGLVAITAACDSFTPLNAIIVGAIGTVLATFTHEVLRAVKIDDVVGAFPVHGIAGMWGTVAFALFAGPEFFIGTDRFAQLGIQTLGTLAAGGASFVSVFLLLVVVRQFTRLRVSAGAERDGLNMAEHGATTEVLDVLVSMHSHRETGDYSKKIDVAPHTEAGQIANEYNQVLDRVREEIDDHEKTNDWLQSERIRLNSVLENAGVGIYQLDENGRLESANSHMLKILGYRSTTDLIEEQERCLLPWHAGNEDVTDLVQESISKGIRITDLETCLNEDEDNALWLLESLVPVRDENGRLMSWLGTIHDVTDRKRKLLEQIEIAEARSQAKGEFLANMSHEIRTPLNGVIGMMDLIGNTQLDEHQTHYLAVARSSADSLLSIINDILDFSKIEAGKLDLESIEFELRDAIEQTAEQFAVRAHQQNLEMNCELAPDLPYFVVGDPERLRQVLVNLLGNAIKFTREGEINLRVTCRDERIRFAVEDTGIGMSNEVQSRLFQSFMQADASTTREFGGTGLGLAISSQLVQKMGGQIRVVSEEGQGSEFSFELDLAEVKDKERPQKADLCDLTDCRVMVVDDNSTNCEILSTQLTSWGFDVGICQQPKSVVQRLLVARQLHKNFNLVILDFCMPEMNGRDVAVAIRKEAALADVRIVILSSNHELMGRAELDEVGIDVALTKPARQSRLLNAIMTSLRGDFVKRLEPQPALATPANPTATQEAAVDSASAATTNSTAAPAKAIQHTTPEPTVSNPDGELTANVLVAEDNQVNQLVVSQMLDSLGFSVEIANHGLEAFEKFKKGKYQLILMDGHMPEMDGLTATKTIRDYERTLRAQGHHVEDTAIVALTANVVAGFKEECIQSGMNDYLIKPITLERLRGVTDEYCSRSGMGLPVPLQNHISPASQTPTAHTPPAAVPTSPPASSESTTGQALPQIDPLLTRTPAPAASTEQLTHSENQQISSPHASTEPSTTWREAFVPGNPTNETAEVEGRSSWALRSVPGSGHPQAARSNQDPQPQASHSQAPSVSPQPTPVPAEPSPTSAASSPQQIVQPPAEIEQARVHGVTVGLDSDQQTPAPPQTLVQQVNQELVVPQQDAAIPPQTPVANSNFPELFSSSSLSERCGGDPEFEQQILRLMLDSLPERVSEISQAFRDGDIQKVGTVTHQLKGAAADSALLAVHQTAAQLEATAKAGGEDVGNLLAQLTDRVQQTISHLEELVSEN